MDICKEIKFPFKCPVCKKEEFQDYNWLEKIDEGVIYMVLDPETNKKKIVDNIEGHDIHCVYCGWKYDLKQVLNPNIVGDRNKKTVKEMIEEYKQKLSENENYVFDEYWETQVCPHKCPICGEYEFENVTSHDICDVCGWEDDGTEEDPEDDYSDANRKTIREAKLRFFEQRAKNPNYKYINF